MTIRKILSHPLLQLIAFCIILVGSPYFGGPYVYFLYHAGREAVPYAIIGWIGIVITISSLFFRSKRENVLQFIGAAIMVVSLLVFFFSSENFMNRYAFKEVLPLMTLLLFCVSCSFCVSEIYKRRCQMIQLLTFLQAVNPMTAELEQEVRKALRVRDIPKDKHWLREGEICNHIAFIETGLLKSIQKSKRRK